MKKILFAAIMLLAPLAISAQKFGHFNAQEIMEAMPETATMRTELQTLAKQYEDDQKRMEEKAQKITDNSIKEIDRIASEKEKELLAV